MGRKIWNIQPYDKNAASLLSLKCGVDDFAVLLLQTRGIKTEKEVKEFISSQDNELSSPYLLKDMEKAVERIRNAIEAGEKIHIFGDYDADGVTSTALLVSYLEAVGADVTYSIPSRLNEGYGLSPETARRIAEDGAQLVITVDNGIASFEEAEIFASFGIDFIVTDHHKVGDRIPSAYAVIDPHREDDTSPEENLAGVGVALKLVAALEDGDYDCVIEDYGDLATIGTIADIVPLTGENRTIVSRGLKVIEKSYRPGLISLLENAGIKNGVNATSVAFGVAPRINAAGRMNTAETALRLLLTEDFDEAQRLANELNQDNASRQNAETEISEAIEEYFDKYPALRSDRVLVAAGEGWHPGVIGIAASRLVEKYGRPAVVLSVGEDGVARGSCRSIDGLSLYDALSFCSDLLLQFGGHTLAAGFSVDKNNIGLFREKINAYAASLEPFYPSLNIDLRLNPAGISADILDSLSLLEPYGAGNPSPYFGLFGVEIAAIKSIGGNKHIRLNLTKGNETVTAVYFGQPISTFPYKTGDKVDIACRIEKNEFRGDIKVSIQIKDIRPQSEDDKGLFYSLYLYRCFTSGEVLSEDEKKILCPDRQLVSEVYRFIRNHGKWSFSSEILCMRIGCPYIKAGAVEICLDALESVGIINKSETGELTLSDFKGKADLSNCAILKDLGYI